MKIPFTPIVRGLSRSVDDTAQQPGAVRDIMNLLPNAIGRLDGVYRNPTAEVPSTGTPIRWTQWDTYTVLTKKNPSGAVQVTNGVTTSTGPSEDATARTYRTVCLATGASAYAMTSKTDPFTARCYLAKGDGLHWGNCALSGSGTITATFGGGLGIKPTRPGSADPAYIVFDADVAEGSTTARIRACTNPAYTGSNLDSVDYVGDTVAGVTYGYIIWDDDPVWSPSCFSTFRNRLCAADANTVYFSGFIGSASPFVEPDQNNWAFWYELNSVTVGHSGQGNIVRMEPLGDQLIVFLENATYRIYGYPPVNGAYENQLVVEEVNPTLGINSYDAVGVAPDGNALFVAGNDGQAYVFQSQYVLISEPVRLHPQFQNIDIVHVSEQYAIFTGASVDPSRVPFEITPTDGGFTYQTTPAFCFNTEKQMWTMLDQYSLDTSYRLTPVTDPYKIGIFGAFKINDYYEICLTDTDGIKIVNDRTVKLPQLQDTLVCGLATPQIPTSPQFRADSVVAIIEQPYIPKLTAAAPAEDPAGFAPVVRMRDVATSTFGRTSRYALHSATPDAHNYASAAIGYWGEKLLVGMDAWSNALTAIAIDSTPTVQKFTVGGWCDRIDVLLSDIVSCRVTVYEDNAGAVGDVVFFCDMTAPQNGLVNHTAKYWRPFTLGITIPGTYWVGLTGSCNAYRFPSNGSISKSGSVIHAGNSLALRVLEEAGGPFSCKSVLSVIVEGEPLPYDY